MANHEDEQLPPGVPPVTFAPVAPRLRRPPFWMISLLVCMVLASWVPLVLFARAKMRKSDAPRVHIMQDMGTQPRFREQQTSDLFADGRADRPRIPGTVARGQAELDDHLERGFSRGADGKPAFATGFPTGVKVDDNLLKRGQLKFNTFCTPCHGIDGAGHGMFAVRSTELGTPLNPTSVHADSVKARSEGHIYNTINVGIRNMPAYGGQIGVQDRWAIVAYVRALQLAQPPVVATAVPAPPAQGGAGK
ncbi:MAG: cytochrome c [Phycisphaerae bacterium]|nr:cytochrome c [Tepidisphaeraceae bacterium]